MIWTFLTRWFSKKFDWLQVEVTSQCNAACIYCPHTVYRHAWQSRHLSLDTFRKLLPELPRVRLIHLQGWGEPFLNPDLFAMLTLAKQQGCQVSLTTNGMLLDSGKISALVEAELDILAFSLAGVGENNDRVRRGTDYATVLRTIAAVHAEKERQKRLRPALHLAYMVLRSGLADLPRLPAEVSGLGLTQIVLSTLDFVPQPDLVREALVPRNSGEYLELKVRFAEVGEAARRRGLQVYHYLRPPGRLEECPENLQRACFIGADGTVSPCVYLNLPVREEVFWVSAEGKCPYRRLTFGSLEQQSPPEIWQTPNYRRFRRDWRRGSLPLPCQNCLKVF
uniref:Radical SAM protein n=1 Tax=Desulfobacca acetoxidans TaxID=60893 RepID=A0A7C3UZ28_9BACT